MRGEQPRTTPHAIRDDSNSGRPITGASYAGELIGSWRRRPGRVLGFNVGISQSYATLGQIGFAERSGYTAMGNVCNLAARFCDIYAKELHASEVYKMPCRRVRRKLPQRKFAMPFAITAREFGINHEATWKPAIEQMGNAGRPMAVGLKDWRAC